MTTILVVDDNENNYSLARTILEAAGYVVQNAAHGGEALDMARRAPPDLILSSLAMPGMDGYALHRACLQEERLAGVPFLFYTATCADARNEGPGLPPGAACSFMGPLDGEVLLDHVRSIFSAAVTSSALAALRPEEQEEGFRRLDSETLIHKLEDKMDALAATNERLVAREQFVTNILDGLAAHIAIVDAEGIILAVNQAWRNFAETNAPAPAGLCEGTNYLAVCERAAAAGNLDAAHTAEAIRGVLSGELKTVALEYPCHGPQEERWFVVRITPFPGGGSSRVIVAHEDITSRVKAGMALRDSEAALRRSQEVAHVGHWMWDTRSNTVKWSDEMKRIFGLDPAQVGGDLNAVIARAIHPDDAARVLSMNDAVIHEGRPAGTEYRVVWPDGQVRTVWAQPGDSVLDDTGAILQLSGVVQDVTDRKCVEAKLAESLRRLSISTRAAGLGIWEADLGSGKQVWDAQMHHIYGVDPSLPAPTMEEWRRFIHPEDLARLDMEESAASAGGKTKHSRFRIIRADGAVRSIEAHAEVDYGPDGTARRLVGVDRDVTDAVADEQRRRLHSTAVEAAANGIVITNRDGVIEWVNPAFTALTGYTLEEAVGRNPRELVRSGYHDTAFYQDMWETILAGNSWRGELVNRCKDGTHYHEEQSITPVRNESGTISHFVAIKQDVTARVREQEARTLLLAHVQAQAEQLAQLMRSVPEGVALVDAELRVVQANPEAERYLKMLAADDAGARLQQLGDRPIAELLQPPAPGQRHLVRSGHRTFEATAQPVVAGPLPSGWVLVLRDVTEQHALQRQLERQERMAAVGQLAAGVAHDFNNIMSVIITYAQLLEESPSMGAVERKWLGTIYDQGMRATQIIRQILDFSRRSVMERHTVDLLPLLKEEHKLLKQTLPENIDVVFDHDQREHFVNADPTRIQQMLVNLALNARDAMPGGGVLRIELRRHCGPDPLPFTSAFDGCWLRLRVSDTGVGITPEVAAHMFEPFYTTKEPGRGTGLGLAQVQGIVAQHDGHIMVESTPGAGTTFTVYLPEVAVVGIAGGSPIGNTTQLPHGHGELILVVEDEDAVRSALVELLDRLGYRTCEACNGSEALQVLGARKEAIALVLSDVVMPKLGGIGLFEAMRQQQVAAPMILLTGHPLGAELAELKARGLSAWLFKPPAARELAEVIAATIGRARGG